MNDQGPTTPIERPRPEKPNRGDLQRQWQGILRQWERSGKSKAAFCRERNLSQWSFHYWAKRLKERQAAGSGGFIRVEAKATSGIRLRLPSGLEIELESGFDEEVLKSLLRAAASAC